MEKKTWNVETWAAMQKQRSDFNSLYHFYVCVILRIYCGRF